MGLLDVIKNDVKAAIGYQQSFTELLASKDVGRALGFMRSHADEALKNLEEYNVKTHKIMKRADKPIFDKKGNFIRYQKRWRIPIPYQQFINEVALVFLYGRPVKWSQGTDNTDEACDA